MPVRSYVTGLVFTAALAVGLALNWSLAANERLDFVSSSAGASSTSSASSSRGQHPFSKIDAFFFVSRTKVVARLRFFAEDIALFQGVEPNEEDRYENETLQAGLAKHKAFLSKNIRILDADGNPLPVKVIDSTPFVVPEGGIPSDKLMDYTIDMELEYTLAKEPEFLTFIQSVVDLDFTVPSEVIAAIKQEGREDAYALALKPEEPFTHRLDWTNLAPSSSASEQDWEAWFKKQEEEALGITNYGSVYSFLYIERGEARHEILIPLATVATMAPIEHRDPNFLEIEEQPAAIAEIGKLFTKGNPVLIDGKEIPPVITRIDFFGLNMRDFAQQSEKKRVSMANGRVGIILTYKTDREPERVSLTWNKFTDTIRRVDSVILAFDKAERFEFSRIKAKQNTYEWTNSHAVPAAGLEEISVKPIPGVEWNANWIALFAAGFVGLGLAAFGRFQRMYLIVAMILVVMSGAIAAVLPANLIASPFAEKARIKSEQANEILEKLLTNVYRSFSADNKTKVYDALAKSAEGELLTDLYLQIRRGLELQDQGGAIARVEKVDFPEVLLEENRSNLTDRPVSVTYSATWNVAGTVEHWGHVHRRVNQYQADFDVRYHEGNWKLHSMKLTDEKRLEAKTTPRRLEVKKPAEPENEKGSDGTEPK